MTVIFPVREFECISFCCLVPDALTTIGPTLLSLLPVGLNSGLPLVANLINVS